MWGLAATHTLPAPHLHPHPVPQPDRASQSAATPTPAAVALAAWQQDQSEREYLSGCRCLSHHCRKPKKARRGKRRQDRPRGGGEAEQRERRRRQQISVSNPNSAASAPRPGSSPAGQGLQLRCRSPNRCTVGPAGLRQAPESAREAPGLARQPRLTAASEAAAPAPPDVTRPPASAPRGAEPRLLGHLATTGSDGSSTSTAGLDKVLHKPTPLPPPKDKSWLAPPSPTSPRICSKKLGWGPSHFRDGLSGTRVSPHRAMGPHCFTRPLILTLPSACNPVNAASGSYAQMRP